MPVFLPKILQETAVYWAPDTVRGSVDDYGQPQWADPIEISVRWERKEQQMMDAEGNLFVSRAEVFVDRDLETRGVLMLGTLSTSVIQDDPKANENAWEIRRFEKFGNFKSTKFVRQAFL